jgi:hypothetical protein
LIRRQETFLSSKIFEIIANDYPQRYPQIL